MTIWKIPEPTKLCEYVSVGTFSAIVANNYVIVEEFQSIFIFNQNSDIQVANTHICFPKNTYSMETDIYISFPNISHILASDKSISAPMFNIAKTVKRKKGQRAQKPQLVWQMSLELLKKLIIVIRIQLTVQQ